MAEEILMFALRAEDASLVARGSSTDYHCSRCKARVVIAPSSVTLLRGYPEVIVCCMHCATPEEFREQPHVTDLDAVVREIEDRVPNPWRTSN